MLKQNHVICLLNDSFPPTIDGVSNTVFNYAMHLQKNGDRPLVITPDHPNAEDEKFPFTVARYPSFNFSKLDAYMAGIPFSPDIAHRLKEQKVDLLHCHCPIMSGFLARTMRRIQPMPLITTYHTKFDIDIENVIKNTQIQNICKKFLASNLRGSDEVWAVSRGAGENTRKLGYEGNYIVMPNGVDMPHEKIAEDKVLLATKGYDLPENIPVYLFVGRMMWYKGLQIILDALSLMHQSGKDFRMVMIGSGDDLNEVKNYARILNLYDKCIFTGPIHDREALRAWYKRADLFLFPSSYDTNGLVVREAAACDLASVLIQGSCAAENVIDGHNGFLIEENKDSLYQCLYSLYDQKDKIREVGVTAGNELYLSWTDAVNMARERYQFVIEAYKRGEYPKHRQATEGFVILNSELMSILGKIESFRRE